MKKDDPNKLARMTYRWAEDIRHLHATLAIDAAEVALAFEATGGLLRLEEFEILLGRFIDILADLRPGSSSFTSRIRRMTRNVDDWSTTHGKGSQLASPESERIDGRDVRLRAVAG